MDFNQVLEKRKIRIHSLEAPKIGLWNNEFINNYVL